MRATIHHGIDTDDFPLRSRPDGYLLFFGRIHPDKGTAEAIEIAHRVGKTPEAVRTALNGIALPAHLSPECGEQIGRRAAAFESFTSVMSTCLARAR